MIYQQFKNNLLQFFAREKRFKRLIVAYSGGLDSSVLLDLVARLVREEVFSADIKILVIHVNHNIHQQANNWELHCKKKAVDYGFEFCCYAVEGLVKSDFSKIANLEQKARDARYQIFQSLSKSSDLFLLAHHQDDQAETVLFNLFKGHGQSALSGMPTSRLLNKQDKEGALVFRPLMAFSKAQLLTYGHGQNLTWVEDDSNFDERFSRNFIRQQLLPRIKEQWPDVLSNVSRSALFLAENQKLINDIAKNDFLACACVDASLNRWGESISLERFLLLDRVRQKHVIRFWLDSKNVLMPGHKVLDELLNVSIQAKDGSNLLGWKQEHLQIHFQCFAEYLFLGIHSVDQELVEKVLYWDLQKYSLFTINHRKFKAELQESTLLKQALLKADVNILEIRFRQGGERCTPSERQHSQSLKKLLQEYRVPPWERDTLPLFYFQNELVAVADLWVCTDFQAKDEPGWLLSSLP